MALVMTGEYSVDRNDPRNRGVEDDQIVGPSNSGVAMRRIEYVDPATGKRYNFITNEMTLPPGLLAYIYRKRWDIEKIFDQMKNKLDENKAWSKDAVAKCQQAEFQCLCHNLMLILERTLKRDHGVEDKKVKRKAKARIEEEIHQARKAGRQENPLTTKVHRATQRSLQFIRWLRDGIILQTSWSTAMNDVRPLMEGYLI